MRTFAKHNECLSETMKTHLIVDLDKFGIWTNDYFAFFKARITVFHKELKSVYVQQIMLLLIRNKL